MSAETAGDRELRRPWLLAIRLLLHICAWVPIAVGAIGCALGGWVPSGDNAVITIRAWGELAGHGTLIGQQTFIPHVFDLGPLEYWLITVPVHIDPTVGALLGASFWCMVAASIAIEAARSAFGLRGGVLAAAFVAGAVAWLPVISQESCWNPHFGEFWFLAMGCSAMAVMMGRRSWWPCLVFCGSVATQAHLMFALPSILLIALSAVTSTIAVRRLHLSVSDPAAVNSLAMAGLDRDRNISAEVTAATAGGGAGGRVAEGAGEDESGGRSDGSVRRGRLRGWAWLVVGLGVGLVCWLPSVVQELIAGRNGNMGLLISSQSTPGARTGIGYGLRALSVAANPIHLIPPGDIYSIVNDIPAAPLVLGLLVVIIPVAALAIAWRWKSRLLGVLGVVDLILLASLGAQWANTPTTHLVVASRYLVEPMFPVGGFTVLTLCIGAWLVVRLPRPEVTAGAPGSANSAVKHSTSIPRRLRMALGTLLVGGLVVTALVRLAPAFDRPGSSEAQPLIPGVCRTIERQLPPGDVQLRVAARNIAQVHVLAYAIMACLVPDGYSPELPAQMTSNLGIGFNDVPGAPIAVVDLRTGHDSVAVSR